MTELYLGAHVVRGQKAFDIMEEIEIGDEIGWIIPTSGHRAYPYWTMNLRQVYDKAGNFVSIPEPPYGALDHYSTTAAPRGTGLITNLAERLGFVPKPPTITRR